MLLEGYLGLIPDASTLRIIFNDGSEWTGQALVAPDFEPRALPLRLISLSRTDRPAHRQPACHRRMSISAVQNTS